VIFKLHGCLHDQHPQNSALTPFFPLEVVHHLVSFPLHHDKNRANQPLEETGIHHKQDAVDQMPVFSLDLTLI
jgi:hypothetical protein